MQAKFLDALRIAAEAANAKGMLHRAVSAYKQMEEGTEQPSADSAALVYQNKKSLQVQDPMNMLEKPAMSSVPNAVDNSTDEPNEKPSSQRGGDATVTK